MRILPKNICAHPDGYLVRLERGELKFQAFIPYSRPDAMEEAIRRRDAFYQVAPPAKKKIRKHPRSNTDVVGITETESWAHGLPHRNFIVHTFGRNKRFYFGRGRYTRAQAFKLAVAHRAKAIGKKPKDILPNQELF